MRDENANDKFTAYVFEMHDFELCNNGGHTGRKNFEEKYLSLKVNFGL